MGEALAYFLTWTTYGTWLPGDARGWVNRHPGDGDFIEPPKAALEGHARGLMKESAAFLDAGMRSAVEGAIRRVCAEEGWGVEGLAVQANHVHIVVTVPDAAPPGKVMGVLKVGGMRALNALAGGRTRRRWWTKDGSKRILNSEESFRSAVRYVMNHGR